ncbi:flagellar biosynthesis protein FliR [Gottschalkia purinilytica]|uniref:Flagellar biosynthetic protein FliR n=1 Tax=Gottschalkia purinilytica TaxID=1503 RepID=A0A0L0WBT6_GOTPU|nr:flagellar biosynthetic protein FliR [Gottschalkia purinilytica]KNF08830.1 flagellar biosynthesis protein FliR [Gottschalkia purinilytica]
MENTILDILMNKYQVFIFILIRTTGIFIISPIFSRNNIPNILKIGFSFIMSIILVNVVNVEQTIFNDLEFLIVCTKELVIGLMIGFISYLFFTLFYLSGQIIDMQVGFSMVNVLDPQSNTQVPIMGNFYYMLATVIFLIVNGHHFLIEALVKSYEYVGIGTAIFNDNLLKQFIFIIGKIFIIAFKISSPILVTIILVDALLGILARTMPQMNVFIVGLPLKIIIGISIIIASLPLFFTALQHIFNNMYEEIFNFLKVIQKGW